MAKVEADKAKWEAEQETELARIAAQDRSPRTDLDDYVSKPPLP